MKTKIISFIIVLMWISSLAFGQSDDLPNSFRSGLSSFESGEYNQALMSFRDVLLDSSLERYYGDSYYWIGRSYLALGKISQAAQNIDFFITQYPSHRLVAEAEYQKGRILYLQEEYEKAIRQLYDFADRHPDHPFQANAFFWIAESFYALGHFDKATKVYDLIIRDYPRSSKLDAAEYRRSVIELKQREQELLKLLKISHEEYLNALQEFQQREREYEQAISSYQRRLASVSKGTGDSKEEIDRLSSNIQGSEEQIASLQRKLEQERERVAELQEALEQAEQRGSAAASIDISSLSADKEKVQQLLELKNKALSLKLFYIEWLQENMEETE